MRNYTIKNLILTLGTKVPIWTKVPQSTGTEQASDNRNLISDH